MVVPPGNVSWTGRFSASYAAPAVNGSVPARAARLLDDGADRPVQHVVFDAELPSVLVPGVHDRTKHVEEGPATAHLGALGVDRRARYAGEAAGDLAPVL